MTAATDTGTVVQRQHLVQALNQVAANAAPKGSSLPVLAGVRLQVDDGRLTVTTTDLDLEVATTVQAEGDHLDAVVPAKLLKQLVATANGPIAIRPGDTVDELVVTWGRTTALLRTLPIDEWPRPKPVDGDEHKLTAPDVAAFRRVANFASRDDARPILTGVLVNGIEIAATDSYRLAVAQLTTKLWEAQGPILLPSRVARYLPPLLDSEHATLTVDGLYAEIRLGEIRLRTVLIDGDFPPYERLIPTTSPSHVTFNRAELADAVRTATVMAQEAAPIRIVLGDSRTEATILSVTQDIGQVGTIVAATVEGAPPPHTAAFNPTYFAALLTTCSGENVTLELIDQLKPALIREDPYTLLIMPVRVS